MREKFPVTRRAFVQRINRVLVKRDEKLRKLTVTRRALVQRINRVLAKRDEKLRKLRRSRGTYYVVNLQYNSIVAEHVDLEEAARELGALEPWERLEEED